MIDIHTHILFDVDDGAESIAESIAILRVAAINNVTDIIVTPHYIDGGLYDKEKVDKNYKELLIEVKMQDLPIKLHFGNEIMVYGNIAQILDEEKVATLAESKYMLIEFPMNSDVNYINDTIYEMRVRNIIPIIAHPERCDCFKNYYDRILEAHKEGALFQCNTESIIGTYGNTAKKVIKKMLKDDLVTFLATDTHNLVNNRYPNLEDIEKKVKGIISAREKNKLFSSNAKCILENIDINREEDEI